MNLCEIINYLCDILFKSNFQIFKIIFRACIVNNYIYSSKNMESRKDLLFFSNYCDFCKKIIDLIIKNNIRDRFIFVCVDNKTLAIPKFVNRVPMVLTYFKDIYADSAVIDYVESLIPKKQNESLEEISPFTLGTAMEQKISGPEPKTEDTSRTSKMDSSLFEKYINSRKNDDDAIKKMQNGANISRV